MLNLPSLCLLALLSVSALAEPLHTTLNHREISPRLTTSGQISSAQIASLKAAEIDLVINLTMEASEQDAQEGYAVTKLGIDYIHIPVPWDRPTQEDLALFFGIMDLSRKKNVLVHCFANYRASAFVYLYRRTVLNVPEEAARADLDAIWSADDWVKYPQWDAFIRSTIN
ncbi:MAG: protein tyrosine phosphatase family protein [Pseudomonadales bacterium]